MLNLKDVTLLTCTNYKINETLLAMQCSMNAAKWGDVVFVTDQDGCRLLAGVKNIQVKRSDRLTDYWTYSDVCVFDLPMFIETPYILIVQHDGFVLNTDMWSDDFLNFDYIGALMPEGCWPDKHGVVQRVGNGGFSLRSKKLAELPLKKYATEQDFRDEFNFKRGVSPYYYEDKLICADARWFYEKHGCVFADEETAKRFSREPGDFVKKDSFGFHRGDFWGSCTGVKIEKL